MGDKLSRSKQVAASAQAGDLPESAWRLHQFWKPGQNPSFKIQWPTNRTHAQSVEDKLRWRQGTKFESLFLPTRLKFESSKVRLLDFHCISGPEINCVSDRFRQLVELCEPGAHQFFPIETELADGQSIPGVRFLLNICHKVTLIKAEVFVGAVGLKAQLDVFPRDSIRGKHLWLSRLPGTGLDFPFVSDVLKKEIEKAACTNLEFSPYRVVDGLITHQN